MKNQDLSFFKALLLREMESGMCQECGAPMYEGKCMECGYMEEDSKLEEKVDMEELEMMLKKLKKDNPGKKVTYTFKKDSPKGYVFFIDKKLVKEDLPDELQAQIVGEASEKNISYLAGYADGALQGYDKGYMDCLNEKPYNVTGITSPKNESKIAENDDSVKHFNSAPNKQDWIDQFYSALNAKLENEPELKAKAQEALEIMGDSGVIDMYGTFQPHVAVAPFLGDIDELISHYRSGLKENHEGQDHEVSMANNSIDSILWAANELKKYLGDEERDIPAWIQDHITNAENYILQAAKNFHDYGHEEDSEEEYGDEDTQDMSLASLMEAKKKPSAGLTKKQKSAIAKKAKAGKDVGKKGKGFEKVAAKAAKKYGSKERGQKVAAAAMWKAAASKAKK